MSLKNSSIPDYVDAPSSDYFLLGNYTIDSPFKGSSTLQILKQDCCSINGTFPSKGSPHEAKNDFKLFNIGEPSSINGGFLRATLYYCSINGTYSENFRQQVQFYGIRKRETTYTEKYETSVRESRTSRFMSNGTLISYPVVYLRQVMNQRTNKVFDIVAREPFSQEVTCKKITAFHNTWETESINDSYIKEKLQITDGNPSTWKKTIEEHYDSNKHPDSVEFVMPQTPVIFTETLATNYVSETSSPSASWYSGQMGKEGYIVQSSVIEDFLGGGLRKIEWVETKYK